MASRRTTSEREKRVARGAYVGGSAAPKLEPQREERRQVRQQPKKRARNQAAKGQRRSQAKALGLNLPYVLMLSAASLVTVVLCVNYLHQQSILTERMNDIEQKETSLETLRSENDALETNINASMDLNEIYRIATEELGMVYAGKNQVLLFDKTESQYVRQNEDIPEH